MCSTIYFISIISKRETNLLKTDNLTIKTNQTSKMVGIDFLHHAIKHLKFSVPLTILGTPSWHQCQLKDLITMVDTWCLQDFFLRLVANEVSET